MPPRVLVAEPNLASRQFAARILEDLGCSVDLASDGASAVEMCAAGDYSVVLTACDVADAIRRRVPGLPPRIVALARQAPYSAADDYIEKPLRAEELRTVLRRWS